MPQERIYMSTELYKKFLALDKAQREECRKWAQEGFKAYFTDKEAKLLEEAHGEPAEAYIQIEGGTNG